MASEVADFVANPGPTEPMLTEVRVAEAPRQSLACASEYVVSPAQGMQGARPLLHEGTRVRVRRPVAHSHAFSRSGRLSARRAYPRVAARGAQTAH